MIDWWHIFTWAGCFIIYTIFVRGIFKEDKKNPEKSKLFTIFKYILLAGFPLMILGLILIILLGIFPTPLLA